MKHANLHTAAYTPVAQRKDTRKINLSVQGLSLVEAAPEVAGTALLSSGQYQADLG